MKTSITFRHMQPSPAMKEYVMEKLSRLDKFAKNASEAHVILTVEKNEHHAEVVVQAKGIHAQGNMSSQNMYASIDGAVTKVTKTLQRHHDKQITDKAHAERLHEVSE